MTCEPLAFPEIEEHGAAAEKRFDVGAELARVEPPERGQQLTLAADPLEQRLHRRWHVAVR